MVGWWITSRSGWLLELLTELTIRSGFETGNVISEIDLDLCSFQSEMVTLEMEMEMVK